MKNTIRLTISLGAIVALFSAPSTRVFATSTTYTNEVCQQIHPDPFNQSGPTDTGSKGYGADGLMHEIYKCSYQSSDCKACSSDGESGSTCTYDSSATCTTTTYDANVYDVGQKPITCPSIGDSSWVASPAQTINGTCS
jgi:hypothetical protein